MYQSVAAAALIVSQIAQVVIRNTIRNSHLLHPLDKRLVQLHANFGFQIEQSHLLEILGSQVTQPKDFFSVFLVLRDQLDAFDGNLVSIVEHLNNPHIGNVGNKRLNADANLEAFFFKVLVEPVTSLNIWDVGLQVFPVVHIADGQLESVQVRSDVAIVNGVRFGATEDMNAILIGNVQQAFRDLQILFNGLKRI